MKRLFTATILAAAALISAATQAPAQSIEALRSKVALEGQIEERIRRMTASYLNTEDVAVAAKVNVMVSSSGDPKAGGVRKWNDMNDIVLPGVPAATSMTRDNAAAKAAEAAKNKVRLGISSISVWVVVRKQIAKDQQDKLKKMISDALDLQAESGDAVSIESSAPEKPARTLTFSFMAGMGLVLVCLAVLAAFLYGPFRAFLGRLNDNLAALAAAKKGPAERKSGGGGDITLAGAADEMPAETTMSGALAIAGGGGGAASVLTFDSGDGVTLDKYVNKENVDDLMLILHDEEPEVIAKVVQRIPQKLAFMAIPKYKMKDVLKEFMKRDFEEPEKIKELLGRIKDKMAGSFGGESRLANLMQIMDKKSQERSLAFLRENDAAFAAAVESRYFKFEDLLRYDEMAMRRIFRKAGAESFARCLKNCDQQTTEAFYEALGPAIKELISARMQNMMLTGDTNDSELTILHAVNALAAKGLILSLADVKQKAVQ